MAIKYIYFQNDSEEFMRTVFREIKILVFLTKLKCRFTVRLYDLFMPKGSEENSDNFTGCYIVLEYV